MRTRALRDEREGRRVVIWMVSSVGRVVRDMIWGRMKVVRLLSL